MGTTLYLSLQRENTLMKREENGRLEISLHAWPDYGMINVDLFSCEDFDPDAVVAYLKAEFDTQDAEVNIVERALRSPRVQLTQKRFVKAA